MRNPQWELGMGSDNRGGGRTYIHPLGFRDGWINKDPASCRSPLALGSNFLKFLFVSTFFSCMIGNLMNRFVPRFR